jgi:hypothetical protein
MMTGSSENQLEHHLQLEQRLTRQSPVFLLPTQLFVFPATNHKPKVAPTIQTD